MHTSPGGKRASSKRASLTRLWSIRLGIVLAAGFVAGATAGVVGVNTLEPGHASEPDSLQVLLDSISKGMTPNTPRERASSARTPVAGSAELDRQPIGAVARTEEITVPDLVGTDEGNARETLTALGLNIGTIEFRSSARPTGMVLASMPASNEKVKRGTAVAMVLSDGRGSRDTLAVAPARDHQAR
ncbi:MAG: PASTA domain-containing protein [Gemmatimonas sp.]